MLLKASLLPFRCRSLNARTETPLRRALDIYHDAMRPFVVRVLSEAHGMQDAAHLIAEALADRASSRFRRDLRSGAVDLESAIDSGDIPEIISRYWFRSFSRKFPASRIRVDVRSTVQVIKQARNEVEHWTQRNDMDLETARAPSHRHRPGAQADQRTERTT